MLHRNGTFRWMLCRGAAVRDSDGAVTRLAGSLTDITDAKLADALTGDYSRVSAPPMPSHISPGRRWRGSQTTSSQSFWRTSPTRAMRSGWRTGCDQRWPQRQFGPEAPRVICVNVSARQLAHVDLASDIEAILRDTGLAPSSLKLEITESAYIGDVHAAETTLKRMQSIGIEWSIDDFGTGYSSLSYLHQLQAETVKVDQLARMKSTVGLARRGTAVATKTGGGRDAVYAGRDSAHCLAPWRCGHVHHRRIRTRAPGGRDRPVCCRVGEWSHCSLNGNDLSHQAIDRRRGDRLIVGHAVNATAQPVPDPKRVGPPVSGPHANRPARIESSILRIL
jgi:hypothetical protein